MKAIRVIDNYFEKIISYALVVSLLGILLLAVFNIIMRQFSISFMWVEPFTRHMVFLSTFLGGVIATGKGNHIAIDILKRFLETKKKDFFIKLVDIFVILLSLFTIAWMIKAGIDFSKIELEFGKEAFWGIHSGWLTAIAPLGFTLIALRFLLQLLLLFEGQKNQEDAPCNP